MIFKEIYIKEVKRRYGKVIQSLKKLAKETDFVMLDYSAEEKRYPISHVEVLKEMIESL